MTFQSGGNRIEYYDTKNVYFEIKVTPKADGCNIESYGCSSSVGEISAK